MESKPISKKMAIGLLHQVLGPSRTKEQVEAEFERFVRYNVSMLVAEGCHITATKRGCVTTCRLQGYAQDGSDVRKCVESYLAAHA